MQTMLKKYLVYIKFVKNNIFSIISEIQFNKLKQKYYKILDNKTLKISSVGLYGFKNKLKVSYFSIKILLKHDLEFLKKKNISIIDLKFNVNNYFQSFIINSYLNFNIFLNTIIIKPSYAYNKFKK